jgi:hypothetical protein
VVPHQSEASRRIRWLRGAFAAAGPVRGHAACGDFQQTDTSAIPVKDTSRVRGPDHWAGPGNDLAGRFGRDAAHADWFCGFRLAIDRPGLADRAGLEHRARRRERARGRQRPAARRGAARDLLAYKGFNGKAFATSQAARGTAVLIPPRGRPGCRAQHSRVLRGTSGPVHGGSAPQEKVASFGALLAARTDVYAVRCDNRRTGKAGWVPAMRGGFRKGAPRGEQGYLPLRADVLGALPTD